MSIKNVFYKGILAGIVFLVFSPGSIAFSTYASAPVTGTVNNILILLADFSDSPADVPASDINTFLNAPGTNLYGLNGSVRDYFLDVSKGRLTLNFQPMTYYYRAAHPKSYYVGLGLPAGCRALALEVLNHLEASGFDYSTIAKVPGTNRFFVGLLYAGSPISSAHRSGLTFSADGVSCRYYFTDAIGQFSSSPRMGIFNHELGHTITEWIDLYQVPYAGMGSGVGENCLMSSIMLNTNPVPPSPYLRDVSGWLVTRTVDTVTPCLSVTIKANTYEAYKLVNPANPREVFYLEAVQKKDRYEGLLNSGLLIWHVDETMNTNENPGFTPSQHLMVSFEQADGQYHYENRAHPGDADDYFDGVFGTVFNSASSPDSKWWSGADSGLDVTIEGWDGDVLRVTFNNNNCFTATPTITDTPPVAPTATETVCVANCPGMEWEQKAAGTVFSRAGMGMLVHDGRLWMLAGAGKRDVWSSFDGIAWTQATAAADFPDLSDSKFVTLNGKMYMIGGGNSAQVWSSADGISWTTETSYAGFGMRRGFAAVVFNGRIYVIAGNVNGTPVNDVWWSSDGKMWNRAVKSAGFSPRSMLSAVVHNGRIYAANGAFDGNVVSVYYNDVWSSADGVNWVQETAAAPYAARCDSNLISYGGHMYMTAGVSGIFTPSYNDVWASADGKIWTQKTAAAAFVSRFRAGSAVFQGKMWIAGGSSAAGSVQNIWCSPGGAVATATAGLTHTLTHTPTAVITATETATATLTATVTVTATATQTPDNTPVPTDTPTQFLTPAETYTATAVMTATNTVTEGLAVTFTATCTQTPGVDFTATVTPVEIAAGSVFAYPNPYTQHAGFLNINCVLNGSPVKAGIRVYSSAYRLVWDSGCYPASKGVNNLRLEGAGLNRLSPGTYYYYVYSLQENGKTVKSRIETLIVLK